MKVSSNVKTCGCDYPVRWGYEAIIYYGKCPLCGALGVVYVEEGDRDELAGTVDPAPFANDLARPAIEETVDVRYYPPIKTPLPAIVTKVPACHRNHESRRGRPK